MLSGLRVAIIVAALASAAPAFAVRVVDQTNLVDPASGPLLASSISRFDVPADSQIGQAQTVTAGKAGILGAVDLQLFAYLRSPNNETINFSIFDGALVEGTGTLIGTVQVAQADIPTEAQAQAGRLLTLELSGLNFSVMPGQVFTLYTSIPASGPDFGRGARLVYGYSSGLDADGFPIAVGLAYDRGYNSITYGNGSDLETTFDRGFRTYVDVTSGGVPEPASWMLLIGGFGLAGGTLRLRREQYSRARRGRGSAEA